MPPRGKVPARIRNEIPRLQNDSSPQILRHADRLELGRKKNDNNVPPNQKEKQNKTKQKPRSRLFCADEIGQQKNGRRRPVNGSY